MKHFISSIMISFIVLCVAPSVQGQGLVTSLKVGVSATNITGNTTTNFDPRAGLVGGAGLGYDFGNGLTFQSDLLYITKGAYADTELQTIIIDDDGEESIISVPVRARFDLIYLDLPLYLTYRIGRGRFQPKVFLGPMLSYNASATVETRAVGSDITQSDSDPSIQTFEFGAVGGLGVETEISGERLSLEIRTILGKSNIRETSPSLTNHGIVVLIGFMF